jgi:hypothetical protein
MHGSIMRAVLLIVAFSFSACASTTPSRIGDYLSNDEKVPTNSVITMPDQLPVQAGLLLIADKADPGSGPSLPDEALARFREDLRQELGHDLPLTIKHVIQANGITPNPTGGDLSQFRELGKKHDVEYLALVVVSSTEQEYPTSLDLVSDTHAVPGLWTDNWTLAEFALVDLNTGRTMLQARGQGSATLDRPYAPGVSQRYPVVYVRPGSRHVVWPPTWEGAPNTLRVVSLNLAGKDLVYRLSRVWSEYLKGGAMARPAEK